MAANTAASVSSAPSTASPSFSKPNSVSESPLPSADAAHLTTNVGGPVAAISAQVQPDNRASIGVLDDEVPPLPYRPDPPDFATDVGANAIASVWPTRLYRKHTAAIRALTFNDSVVVAANSDGTVCIWDMQTTRCLRELSSSKAYVFLWLGLRRDEVVLKSAW